MKILGEVDPFGKFVELPDGNAVPEITVGGWRSRNRTDETIQWVIALVRSTGLAAWFEDGIRQEKERVKPDTKRGRPRTITVEAILVGWFMCQLTRRSLLHTEVADFLLNTLTPADRRRLGVPDVLTAPGSTAGTDKRYRYDQNAVAARVGRLMGQMTALIDPSPYRQPRSCLPKGEIESLRRDVTAEELAAARSRLDWVTTQLLAAPLTMMPRKMRRQYKGDVAVDDTHLPLHARRASRHKEASDVDGGLYMQTKPPATVTSARPAQTRPVRPW